MDIRYYCEHVAFYKLFSHDPVKVISKILTEKEDFIYNYFLHEYDSHQEAFPYQEKDFKVEIKEYDQALEELALNIINSNKNLHSFYMKAKEEKWFSYTSSPIWFLVYCGYALVEGNRSYSKDKTVISYDSLTTPKTVKEQIKKYTITDKSVKLDDFAIAQFDYNIFAHLSSEFRLSVGTQTCF